MDALFQAGKWLGTPNPGEADGGASHEEIAYEAIPRQAAAEEVRGYRWRRCAATGRCRWRTRPLAVPPGPPSWPGALLIDPNLLFLAVLGGLFLVYGLVSLARVLRMPHVVEPPSAEAGAPGHGG